jgi:preprotein translocase subunit SecE
MNRQMKRMQERQERQQRASVADRRQAAATSARRTAGPAGGREGRKRVGARQFLKEVRQELNKVDWPTRKELGTYTVVVLATVIVLTAFVFALDLGFSKAIVNILGS